MKVEIPWWVYESYEDEKSDIIIARGGLGSGKTFGSVLLFILRLLQNDRVPLSWAIAPTYTLARDVLIPTFIDVGTNLLNWKEGRDYRLYKSIPYRIRLRHGTDIVFHSGDKPENLVGANIANFLITEYGIQKQIVLEKCLDRMRIRNKVNQGIVEGTPEGLNHYADLANFEGYNAERNARCFRLRTKDNPHNHEGYYRRLERTYGHDQQRLIAYTEGYFTSFNKGTAYWEFAQSHDVVEMPILADPHRPIHFSWDFGVNPLATVASQRYTIPSWDILKDEHRFYWCSTGEARGIIGAVAEFVKAHDPLVYRNTPIEIDGGHDGYSGSHLAETSAFELIRGLLSQKYNRVSIVAAKSAPLVKERLQHVNQAFAERAIKISNQATQLIDGLTKTNLKPNTWELDKRRSEDRTHFPDAMCHPILRLWRLPDPETGKTKKVYGLNRS
jgi:hypothetical protein